MGEFNAFTFDELFEGTKALPWEDWIPADGQFPVEGRSHKSRLARSRLSGHREKAIVEKLKLSHRTEWFPEDGPDM